MRRAFQRRLRWTWGRAFDCCEVVTVAVRELPDLDGGLRDAGSREGALHLIQGRAIGVMEEVLDLARAGHPGGAYARARTLHELAITATLLAEGDYQLALRWFDYAEVQRASDAVTYQKLADAGTHVALPTEELDRLGNRKSALQAQYGKALVHPNGWAAELATAYVATLPPNNAASKAPTWALLGEIAGRGHFRSYYRLGCHYAHGGPHGTVLNLCEYNGMTVSLTGGTNAGLPEPVSEALLHLVNVAVAYLLVGRDHHDPNSEENVLVAEVLVELLDRANEKLTETEDQVADNHAAFLRPLSRRRISESARCVGCWCNRSTRNALGGFVRIWSAGLDQRTSADWFGWRIPPALEDSQRAGEFVC